MAVMKLELTRETKNPAERSKKREPACVWLIPRSDSMTGRRGARIVRAIKLTANIEVKRNTGPKYLRRLSSLFSG